MTRRIGNGTLGYKTKKLFKKWLSIIPYFKRKYAREHYQGALDLHQYYRDNW